MAGLYRKFKTAGIVLNLKKLTANRLGGAVNFLRHELVESASALGVRHNTCSYQVLHHKNNVENFPLT